MIVGADAANDSAIVARAATLYDRFRLRRVYYSAFSPIPDASAVLPLVRPPLLREHRLYQADWMIRFYGFSTAEVAASADAAGNLPLDIDPKLAWALKHRGVFPVDVNRAPREALLRVPGLGVTAVDKILAARHFRQHRLADIARLTVSIAKVRPFLIAADWRPVRSWPTASRRCRARNSWSCSPLEHAMRVVDLRRAEDDFDGWRGAARALALAARAACRGALAGRREAPQDLFGDEAMPAPPRPPAFLGPARLRRACPHGRLSSDPERFALLYALARPVCASEPEAIDDMPPIRCSAGSRRWRRRCAATCTRCTPSCAFARSRRRGPALRRLVRARPPYRPRQCRLLRPPLRDHALVDPDARALAPLGRRDAVAKAPARRRPTRRQGDPVEEVWKTYYASIFNPARREDRRDAEGDAEEILEKHARDGVGRRSWSRARRRGRARWWRASAVAGRRQCRQRAGRRCAPRRCTAPAATSTNARTQTVFGEGPLDARILFVGEQPGDQEDLAGRPFVGPAGQLFDRALADAGIDRDRTYVTNAVKHFKFERRGKRRIHDKPERRRDRRLPLVAPAGAGADPPAAHRRAWRHRGALAVRQGGDDLEPARTRPQARRGRRGLGHRPPQLPAPRPRRQGGGICPLRRRPAPDRRTGGRTPAMAAAGG